MTVKLLTARQKRGILGDEGSPSQGRDLLRRGFPRAALHDVAGEMIVSIKSEKRQTYLLLAGKIENYKAINDAEVGDFLLPGI